MAIVWKPLSGKIFLKLMFDHFMLRHNETNLILNEISVTSLVKNIGANWTMISCCFFNND